MPNKMAIGTLGKLVKNYTSNVTYNNTTITWTINEFSNGLVIGYADCGAVSASATISGSGGYYSDIQSIPFPIALTSGIPIAMGSQISFISNIAYNTGNRNVNFRIVSLNSRQSIMLPTLIVFGVK